MIYVIGAISLISLAINILIYRRITATYPLGSVETVELGTGILNCCQQSVERIEPEVPELESQEKAEEPSPVTVPMVREVYQGWKNQKGIPWIPPVTPPAPVIKEPSNRGPLARPDGFV